MAVLSDSDLEEFSASGQWRCTVEELQSAVKRMLAEKHRQSTDWRSVVEAAKKIQVAYPWVNDRYGGSVRSHVWPERDRPVATISASAPSFRLGELRLPSGWSWSTDRTTNGTSPSLETAKATADAALKAAGWTLLSEGDEVVR